MRKKIQNKPALILFGLREGKGKCWQVFNFLLLQPTIIKQYSYNPCSTGFLTWPALEG